MLFLLDRSVCVYVLGRIIAGWFDEMGYVDVISTKAYTLTLAIGAMWEIMSSISSLLRGVCAGVDVNVGGKRGGRLHAVREEEKRRN